MGFSYLNFSIIWMGTFQLSGCTQVLISLDKQGSTMYKHKVYEVDIYLVTGCTLCSYRSSSQSFGLDFTTGCVRVGSYIYPLGILTIYQLGIGFRLVSANSVSCPFDQLG